MNKCSITGAILAIHFFIWVLPAVTNESIAGGHYRIGTLNESHHYQDNEDFNSSHNGFYITHKNNMFGTYYNSEFEQSFFYARSRRINRIFSFSYGVATGYNFGLVPMVGLSAQMSIFKLTLTQEAAVIGLEFPLF